MPMFPDMPVPGSETTMQRPNGSGPALPPGGTSGVLRGLEAALLDMLVNYNPGDIGICELSPQIQLTLPVDPLWSWWSWIENETVNVGAAATDTGTLFTVPQDERAQLCGWYSQRDSGDNTIDAFRILPPVGYQSGTIPVTLTYAETTALRLSWPDYGNMRVPESEVLFGLNVAPILLEPGTTLDMDLAAAGVSASVFSYVIVLKRTKLIRAMGP